MNSVLAALTEVAQVLGSIALAYFTWALVGATKAYVRETERQRKDEALPVLEVEQVPSRESEEFGLRVIRERPFEDLHLAGCSIRAGNYEFFTARSAFGHIEDLIPPRPQRQCRVGGVSRMAGADALKDILTRSGRLVEENETGSIGYAQYESLAGECLTTCSVHFSLYPGPGNPVAYKDGLVLRDTVSFEQVLREYTPRWREGIESIRRA